MSLIDTRFQVDESKCVGCGLCQLACPSMLIEMNEHKKPSLKPVKSMDWYGCCLLYTSHSSRSSPRLESSVKRARRE